MGLQGLRGIKISSGRGMQIHNPIRVFHLEGFSFFPTLTLSPAQELKRSSRPLNSAPCLSISYIMSSKEVSHHGCPTCGSWRLWSSQPQSFI